MTLSRWWHLDLAAEFPELEIYNGHGWGPAQELGLIELGERVMTHESLWLPTWFYSKKRDRHWAAVSCMFGMIIQRLRDLGYEEITKQDIPAGWYPDIEAWNGEADST